LKDAEAIASPGVGLDIVRKASTNHQKISRHIWNSVFALKIAISKGPEHDIT